MGAWAAVVVCLLLDCSGIVHGWGSAGTAACQLYNEGAVGMIWVALVVNVLLRTLPFGAAVDIVQCCAFALALYSH